MIDPAVLQAYIKEAGPWIFHGAPTADLPRILDEGIVPGSDHGRSTAPKAFHRTRPGHVYLCSLEHREQLRQNGDLPGGTVRVDLRHLDPSLVDPDEDRVQHARWFDNESWVEADPPLFGPEWEAGPNGEGTLAYWAETTPGFDAAKVTARSLASGRISYRGTVPSTALALHDTGAEPGLASRPER